MDTNKTLLFHLRSASIFDAGDLDGFLVREGGWKRAPGKAAEEEPAAVPASLTKLLQMPITVSLIGR